MAACRAHCRSTYILWISHSDNSIQILAKSIAIIYLESICKKARRREDIYYILLAKDLDPSSSAQSFFVRQKHFYFKFKVGWIPISYVDYVHKKLVLVVRSSKTNRSCSGSVASALTTKLCGVKATKGVYCI